MTRRLAVTVYITPDVYARLKGEADRTGTVLSELLSSYLAGYSVRFPIPESSARPKRPNSLVLATRVGDLAAEEKRAAEIAARLGVPVETIRRVRAGLGLPETTAIPVVREES